MVNNVNGQVTQIRNNFEIKQNTLQHEWQHWQANYVRDIIVEVNAYLTA